MASKWWWLLTGHTAVSLQHLTMHAAHSEKVSALGTLYPDGEIDQGFAGAADPGTLFISFADVPSGSFVQHMHLIVGAQILEEDNALPEGLDAMGALQSNAVVCTEVADMVLIAGATMQTLSRDSLQSPCNFKGVVRQLVQRRSTLEEECCVCMNQFRANFFKFQCEHYICVSCVQQLSECPLCRCDVLM